MTKLSWDAVGKRFFELGVNQGVLYPAVGPGVVWNGLIGVSQKTSGGEATPYYMDGIKYLNEATNEEFEATLEAFTYPDEFLQYDGMVDHEGLVFHQQERLTFGLSYRTLVGNDVESKDLGYKIHLVYNALASPTEGNYESMTDNPEATTFSWDITTSPVIFDGAKPTAHLSMDSTKVLTSLIRNLEKIIYGTSTTAPRLPLPPELIDLVDNHVGEGYGEALYGIDPYGLIV